MCLCKRKIIETNKKYICALPKVEFSRAIIGSFPPVSEGIFVPKGRSSLTNALIAIRCGWKRPTGRVLSVISPSFANLSSSLWVPRLAFADFNYIFFADPPGMPLCRLNLYWFLINPTFVVCNITSLNLYFVKYVTFSLFGDSEWKCPFDNEVCHLLS